MTITVTQIVNTLNDHEDASDCPSGPGGKGSQRFYAVPIQHSNDNEVALDWFHSTISIGCLDDFDICVVR